MNEKTIPWTAGTRIAAGLAALAMVSSAMDAAAVTPELACQGGKLKATSSYSACRLKADAAAAAYGRLADYSKCEDRFTEKFVAAETRAGTGVCPSEGDVDEIKNFIDACSTDVVVALSGDGLPLEEPGSRTIKSGQGVCWDSADTSFPDMIPCAGTGQDGEFQYGVAFSYTDNGDGTISDDNTGLMWEKLDDNNLPGLAGIHDWDNYYTWADAFGKVAVLNGISFAGHTDWRLPNRKELETLIDLGRDNPAVDPAFHTDCTPGCTTATCSCTQSNYSWSSNTYQYDLHDAWAVLFIEGRTSPFVKTDATFVRAVRGG